LPAGLFPGSANACAILSATEGVPANETFDITANRQSAFREREQGRHFFNPKMAIVTSRLNLLTRQRYGLELPAQPVARLLARSQSLGRLQHSNRLGRSSLPRLIAMPKRTRSDGVDRNPLDPAWQE
jgi:hypothetical protein